MLICALVIAATLPTGQQHQMQPGMHFDQMAAVHHFLIETGGGTITLDARDTNGDATRTSIREHLKMCPHLARSGRTADVSCKAMR